MENPNPSESAYRADEIGHSTDNVRPNPPLPEGVVVQFFSDPIRRKQDGKFSRLFLACWVKQGTTEEVPAALSYNSLRFGGIDAQGVMREQPQNPLNEIIRGTASLSDAEKDETLSRLLGGTIWRLVSTTTMEGKKFPFKLRQWEYVGKAEVPTAPTAPTAPTPHL